MSMKNENDNRNRKKQITIAAIILIIILLLSLSRCSFGATEKPINDNASNTSDVKDDDVEVTKPSGGSDSNNSNQKPSDKPSGGDKPTDKPSTPDTPTQTPDPKPEEKPKPEPTPDPEPEEPQKPSHTHNWAAVTKTVHHDEVGHYETVCVKEAWTEEKPIYGYEYHSICNGCGAEITGNESQHNKQHALNGEPGGWTNKPVKVQTGTETIHHDAEYEQEWIVDKAAWDEEVITGYTCSCGATK